jgi:hypothetical protein
MKANKEKEAALSWDYLREILGYSKETGEFTWKVRRGGKAVAGSIAGRKSSTGYIQIGINGNFFLAHRLAWFYVKGEWPEGCIDHINGIRSDNRWINFRAATRSQNQHNGQLRSNNKSGHKNVSINKKSGKWDVKVCKGRKVHHGGSFSNIAEAARAAAKLREKLHGDFVRNK